MSDKACHTCGEVGHLKRDCPQGDGGRGRGARGRGGRGSRGARSDTAKADKACLKCGEKGHLKRNCPELTEEDRAVCFIASSGVGLKPFQY